MPRDPDAPRPFDFPRWMYPPEYHEPGWDPASGRRGSPAAPPSEAGEPAVVIPIPTKKPPTPVPFPTGPAANDPIFTRYPGLGNIIRGGVISAVLFEAGKKILKELERLEQERKEQEAQATFEQELERRERRRQEEQVRSAPVFPPSEVIVTAPLPPIDAPPEIPEFEPGRIDLPEVPEFEPAGVPEPALDPGEIVEPTMPEEPLPQQKPAPPPPVPSTPPSQFPGSPPLPGIRVFPFPPPFGLPRSPPLKDPVFRPVGDILPEVPPEVLPRFLTPTDPRGVSSPYSFTPDPTPAPQPDEAERCQQVKRRRRRKGKCREGFFKEYPDKTKYITWREVDCGTRRSNVITFPRTRV